MVSQAVFDYTNALRQVSGEEETILDELGFGQLELGHILTYEFNHRSVNCSGRVDADCFSQSIKN